MDPPIASAGWLANQLHSTIAISICEWKIDAFAVYPNLSRTRSALGEFCTKFLYAACALCWSNVFPWPSHATFITTTPTTNHTYEQVCRWYLYQLVVVCSCGSIRLCDSEKYAECMCVCVFVWACEWVWVTLNLHQLVAVAAAVASGTAVAIGHYSVCITFSLLYLS